MKRIYFSILVTALISLFVLGKLLDRVFDEQSESNERAEFIVERHFFLGLSHILSRSNNDELKNAVEALGHQFQINLSLEAKENLSLNPELESQIDSDEGLLIDSDSEIQLIRQINNHPDWLLVYSIHNTLDVAKEDDFKLEFWLTLLFYASFCVVLLIWAFPLTRRLSKLNKLASDFGAGDLSKRIQPIRFSYIEELESSFNRMASQIEELLTENKVLAGSISHDLRTPISCLRFGVDAALETPKLEKKNYYLERMDDDLQRMENMLEAFLDYASLERKRFELSKTKTNIIHLIDSTITACSPLAEKKKIKIELVDEQNTLEPLIDVDPFWVGRAVSNLLTNAIHHAKSKVEIECGYSNGLIKISVNDDGKGIPEDEVKNIFKAFVKLDKSRTQNNHFGLGLAIVARVVSWHNGEVKVSRSKKLHGACFTLYLSEEQS
ncbi:ATP-binding protein [Aliikangiella sp. IMCC44359]|uniref:ATP-binding protein n=1 Tax=Aliikangiella sp. IMCC44359 TaxID=3459125 RepID=UPI00403AF32E